MSDLRAFVCNCPIKGENLTTLDTGGRTRNHIQFSLGGRTFDLFQERSVIVGSFSDLKHKFNPTTEIVVRSVSERTLEKAKESVTDICNLLAFATGSRVSPYGYEFPDGSGNKSFHSVIGTTEYFRPVLEVVNGASVRQYVEKLWSKYQSLKKKRNLPVIFDYLVKAELPQQPVELQLLIVFVVLEGLKDTYAKTNRIPYARGFYRKVSSPPRPNPAREPKYTFEQLLTEMLRVARMRKGLKRITTLRNQIIHSGLSRRPNKSNWRTYERSQDIIREYLLRILGFRGTYFPYSSPDYFKTI